MAQQGAKRKAITPRKLRDEQGEPVPSVHPLSDTTLTRPKTGNPEVSSRLEKAIAELQSLNELLLSGDLDPRVLADFRDAVNRIRTVAWTAQQYAASMKTGEGVSSVLTLLAGDRVRVTYQLCQSIGQDLKRIDVEIPAGSLIQLYEVMSALTQQLKGVVNRLG